MKLFLASFYRIFTLQLSWPCVNEKKKAKKKNYNNSGIVYLSRCEVVLNLAPKI